MRKIVTGAVALAFASALAAPALACPWSHDQTAQTTPPVLAETTVPILPIAPPADEPTG